MDSMFPKEATSFLNYLSVFHSPMPKTAGFCSAVEFCGTLYQYSLSGVRTYAANLALGRCSHIDFKMRVFDGNVET